MDTVRSTRRFHAVLALVLVPGLVALGTAAPMSFAIDDAWITLHNAVVLHEGRDVNFPGVPALVGATSLVHLALIAALMLFMSPEAANVVVSLVAIAAYAHALLALALRLGASRTMAVVTLVLGLGTGWTPLILQNGLETGLMLAALTTAIVLAIGPPSRLLALLCGIMPFIRPELAAFSVALMVRQAWQRGSVPPILGDCALLLMAAAPWLAWGWWSTGSVLPTAAGAKAAFFASMTATPSYRIVLAAASLLISGLAPLLPFLLLVVRVRAGIALLAASTTFLVVMIQTFPVGFLHNQGRYAYILLPVAILGVARVGIEGTGWLRTAVVGLLLAAIGYHHATHAQVFAGVAGSVRELAAVAQWARENLPPDSRILVHDAGHFAYATGFEVTDLVGLKSPSSIAHHRRWTLPSAGEDRSRAVHEIALEAQVTHAVILEGPPGPNRSWWGHLVDGLRHEGWRLEPLRAPAMGYHVFRLHRPAEGDAHRLHAPPPG